MIRSSISQLLLAPVATGRLALLCAIVAVALPTGVRAAVNGSVTGCEFTPYLPFVLLSAIMLGGWPAAAVALASVAVLGGLFTGSFLQSFETSCFTSAAGLFLGSSLLIIAVVASIRSLFVELQSRRADGSGSGIIFSLDRGEVWASWNGSGPPLRLGTQERVEAMMEDFLAQGELSKRLAKHSK